jgi:hypothetical protein
MGGWGQRVFRVMPKSAVEICTLAETLLPVGSSGPRTVTIDRSKPERGRGFGFNGGKILRS